MTSRNRQRNIFTTETTKPIQNIFYRSNINPDFIFPDQVQEN